MKHILEVDSTILEFNLKRVLQDIYLKCEIGTITGLLGRNGAGKSCLMNIIYGDLSPTNKSIRLNSKTIFDAYRSPENIRYLPQFGFIPKSLSLKRIFKDFKLDFSKFTNEFRELKKHYNTRFHKLSGGEQRIIEVYAILLSETKFCMLDEPFSHIMPVHVSIIKNLILKEKANKGIIITDHLYEHIIDISDNLYVLSNGKTYLTSDVRDLETLGYARIN